MIKIDSTYATEYIHYPNLSMAGCYAISAVDSFMNESVLSPKNCLDECSYYELPNVFTPNGDNHNDIYKPLPYRFVEKIDMKIFFHISKDHSGLIMTLNTTLQMD